MIIATFKFRTASALSMLFVSVSFAQMGILAPQPTIPGGSAGGLIRATPQANLDRIDAVYNDFKKLEAVFPVPAVPVTIDMGEFDAATGTFDGDLVTIDVPPAPN